mgnify:CR=1 FL=1
MRIGPGSIPGIMRCPMPLTLGWRSYWYSAARATWQSVQWQCLCVR